MRNFIIYSFFLGLVFLIGVTAASAQTIEEIQAAIKAAGAEWTADDNDVWELHRDLGWYQGSDEIPWLGENADYYVPSGAKALPAQLDWRDYEGENWITPVRNQYSCGSCWAFATAGPIEGHIAYAEGWTDPVLDLSEQQMLSCDDSPGNAGCNGGFTTTSFDYAQNTGLFDEECLPYHATDTWPCDDRCEDWQSRLFKIDTWQIIGQWGIFVQPEDIMDAMQNGPVGTSLTIYNDFFAYTEGIYDTVLGIPQGFHAVTIVGYDADQQYWICKNSWGDRWGEDGYFRIKWGAAMVGMFTILPHYTSQNLGPWPDDDATDDDAADDDAADDDAQDDDAGADDDAVDDDSGDDDTSPNAQDDDGGGDDSGGGSSGGCG